MPTVCIGTSNTLNYYQGGGYLWMFLNWALGFRRLGWQVIWADLINASAPREELERQVSGLRRQLAPFGLADAVALVPKEGQALTPELRRMALGDAEALSAHLLFSFRYDFSTSFIQSFSRSCIFETDPGIVQQAVALKHFDLTPYQICFTNSTAVAAGNDRQFACGLKWEYLPTGVCVEEWPVATAPPSGAAFTTISQWWMEDEYMQDVDGSWYRNDKRAAFLPFLELPRRSPAPLELALNLAGDAEERKMLEDLGWRVREAHEVTPTPLDYQQYIRASLGEWSCAKPSYVRMRTGWTSDRTVCYLASGRPCIVQDTGPVRDLPTGEGLLRFSTLEEAAAAIGSVMAEPDRHAHAARNLAETYFSVTRLIPRVLDRVMT